MAGKLDEWLAVNEPIETGFIIGSIASFWWQSWGLEGEREEIGAGFMVSSTVSGMGSNSEEKASLTEGIKVLNESWAVVDVVGIKQQ